MDFSDIRTIIIGEAGEYGKRLVRYLEIHLSSAVRVYHFTTAEGMVSFKEEAEIYLLDCGSRSYFTEYFMLWRYTLAAFRTNIIISVF